MNFNVKTDKLPTLSHARIQAQLAAPGNDSLHRSVYLYLPYNKVNLLLCISIWHCLVK